MRIIVAGLLLVALSVTQAMAQDCSAPTTAGLTPQQITNLVTNRYACVGTLPNAQWNELHSGGYVLDYKLGPTDPADPSDTLTHPTGTFVVSAPGGAQAPGVVTYTYGSNSYGYYVVANLSGTRPWSGTGTYSFCGMSGGAPQLAVTISASHC